MLKSTIINDPELVALAGVESDPSLPGVLYPFSQDQTILEVLKSRLTPVVGGVSVEQLFEVLYSSGDYLALKQAQMTGVQEVVLAFAILSDAKQFGSGMVDMSSPYTAGLLHSLVSKDLLKQPSVDLLVSIATRQVSKAESLGIGSNEDIAEALGRVNPFKGQ